jgi:hypothetical protein
MNAPTREADPVRIAVWFPISRASLGKRLSCHARE